MTADSQSPNWKKLVDSLADAPLTSVEKSVLINKFMEFQKHDLLVAFEHLLNSSKLRWSVMRLDYLQGVGTGF
jgi:hypothetical protein